MNAIIARILPLLTVIDSDTHGRYVKIMPNGWVRVSTTNFKQVTGTTVYADDHVTQVATSLVRTESATETATVSAQAARSVDFTAPDLRLDSSQLTVGDVAALLVHLRAISGLSWDQIGRTLGVGARPVQYWATGLAARVALPRRERMVEVFQVIASIPAADADERRRKLLDTSAGHGVLHELIQSAPEGQQLHFEPLSVRERLGL